MFLQKSTQLNQLNGFPQMGNTIAPFSIKAKHSLISLIYQKGDQCARKKPRERNIKKGGQLGS